MPLLSSDPWPGKDDFIYIEGKPQPSGYSIRNIIAAYEIKKGKCTSIYIEGEKICPLCEKPNTYSNIHHVHWRCTGGGNHYSNLLEICDGCHALLTFSSAPENRLLDIMASRFMGWVYGLLFALQNKEQRKSINKVIEKYGNWREADKAFRFLSLHNFARARYHQLTGQVESELAMIVGDLSDPSIIK